MAARLTHSGSTAPGLVAALVDSGIIAPEDRTRAIVILDGRLRNGADAAPRSKILAEMAGYAGGILVFTAGAVFLSANRQQMSTTARVGVLAVAALVLAAAALATRLSRPAAAAAADLDLRRRLAGIFGIGAAGLTAGEIGAYLESRPDLHGAALDGSAFAAFAAYVHVRAWPTWRSG